MKLNIIKPTVLSAVVVTLLSLFMITGCQPDDATLPDTCTNNIKDGNEAAVDCGGSCSPCTTTAQRIKKYSADFGGGMLFEGNYVYDSLGRLTSISFGAGSTTITYTYYGNDSIKVTGYNANGPIVYILNSSGYASSVIDPDGTVTYFTYDSEGHLLSNNYGLVNTWDAAGNMLTTSELGGQTFTYLTDKINTAGNENRGRKFLGKSSENLIGTSTQSGQQPIAYTYQYDSENRVTYIQRGTGTETFTYY